MKSLLEMFPRASKSTIDANPHLKGSMGNDLALGRGPTDKNDSTGILKGFKAKRGGMNKTEYAYSLILEAMKRKGEILRYEFEGIRLVWLGNMHYTPDFVVFVDGYNHTHLLSENQSKPRSWIIKLIEVKGGHIWDRDIVRFKGARAYWPEFSFEMHQKTKQGWIRKF